MTENGTYAEECAHLSRRQKEIYDTIERKLMSMGTSNTDYIDGLHAVEALARSLRMTYGVWKQLSN